MIRVLVVSLSLAWLLTTSCKKDENSTDSTGQSFSNTKNIVGYFRAINHYKFYDPSSALEDRKPRDKASFRSSLHAHFRCLESIEHLNAGNISCNNVDLKKDFNNYYAWQDTFKIYPAHDRLVWQVTGRGMIPASVDSINMGFSHIGGVSHDTIFRNQDFSFNIDTLLNCDLINFSLYLNSGYSPFESKMLAGNTKVFSVPKSYMEYNADKDFEGFGELILYAYKYDSSAKSDISYSFVNGTIVSKLVWFK